MSGLPRFFETSIITNVKNEQVDIVIPHLKSIANKHEVIITQQQLTIHKHEKEIEELRKSLGDIQRILNGRQSMCRGMSYEE
tara:strand:+ start:1386 stop:1631 length:246 start_codon:yes stop_codon:yes gene_type:complete